MTRLHSTRAVYAVSHLLLLVVSADDACVTAEWTCSRLRWDLGYAEMRVWGFVLYPGEGVWGDVFVVVVVVI